MLCGPIVISFFGSQLVRLSEFFRHIVDVGALDTLSFRAFKGEFLRWAHYLSEAILLRPKLLP